MDPTTPDNVETATTSPKKKGEWNGEY
jgi:hypothetical protein